MKRKTLFRGPFFLTLITALAAVGIVLSVSMVSVTIPSSAIVKTLNLSVYCDVNCTMPLTSIDWGMLEPGTSENRTIYVKNEGNSALTLSLNTENWSPSNASGYIDLTWNYAGQQIDPEQSIEVVLTLTIATNITGIKSFSFDIVIVGTG